MSGIRSRFDWYEVTFEGHDDGREIAKLHRALGGQITRSKGRNGYAECFAIERDGSTLVQVYGHSSRTGEMHVVASGDACDELVPLIRRFWPEHRVSRADASVDFAADFAELDELAVQFATDAGISYRLVSDSAGGATRYLGAPSSELRLRVYKKSEQLRALHPEAADDVPDGIVRVELQVRPGKRDIKERAAKMSPDDLYGLGRWSQVFAARVLEIDAERVKTHFRRPSEWERALHYLQHQYGPMIRRRAEEVGHEQAVSDVLHALGMSSS